MRDVRESLGVDGARDRSVVPQVEIAVRVDVPVVALIAVQGELVLHAQPRVREDGLAESAVHGREPDLHLHRPGHGRRVTRVDGRPLRDDQRTERLRRQWVLTGDLRALGRRPRRKQRDVDVIVRGRTGLQVGVHGRTGGRSRQPSERREIPVDPGLGRIDGLDTLPVEGALRGVVQG